jgi:glycosyltransferase involved in cell wall biosynthesis
MKLTLKENCYALGNLPRENLRYWYACASIYVLPARYEPFGLTILEAALSGCALVLGGIESLKENWAQAAIFINPADRIALRETRGRVDAQRSLPEPPWTTRPRARRSSSRARAWPNNTSPPTALY